MKKHLMFGLLGVLLISMVVVTKALDIPLSGVSGGGSGQKIGYVDMEKIFQVYPETRFAKEDYAKRLQKKRELLAAKEKELTDIQGRISVLETTFKELNQQDSSDPSGTEGVEASTSAAQEAGATNGEEPEALLSLKKQLEEKEVELQDQKKQAVEELNAFEKQQSQIILGKIYQALKDLAQEEQVNLVVDKSSILFGSAEIDLTSKLQNKVRGF